MSWNYRVVQRRDGSFGLHEVHYEGDRPRAMTENAVAFTVDADEGAAGIVADLELALRDARERPLLIEAVAFPDG